VDFQFPAELVEGHIDMGKRKLPVKSEIDLRENRENNFKKLIILLKNK